MHIIKTSHKTISICLRPWNFFAAKRPRKHHVKRVASLKRAFH